jgi:hypothetical protein
MFKRNTLYLTAIILLALAVYSNSFHCTFQFDDLRTIRFNFSLRDLANWKIIFLAEKSRPLLNATFAINYSFSKLDPFPYHVVNFLLHALNIALFYFLLGRISSNRMLCIASSLLMAVHPMNTESVTYISSRSILLCSSFYFLGLLIFDSYIRKRRFVLLALFVAVYICGSLVKEEAALLPVTALVYEALFFGRNSVRKHFRFYLGIFLLFVAGAIFRIHSFAQVEALPYSIPVYMATEAKVIWHYVWLAFYPVHLNVDPDVSPLSYSNSLFWFFLMLHGFAGYALWRLRRLHPFLTFWGMWFWLNLLLSSSVFPLNDFMAEHRAYLSLFGFCACLSYATFELWMPRTSSPIVVPLIVTFIVIFFSIATYQRNRIWNNELTLWLDTVQKSPEKIRPHLNLGGAYAQGRVFDLAISEYRYVLLLNPGIAQAYGGLGICYLNRNDLEHARAYFERALEIDPGYADGNVGLGMVLYKQRDYAKALFYLLPLYAKRRESVQVVGMIANSYLHTGQFKEAIPFLHEFIHMRPDSTTAHFDLLRSYIYSGLYEQGMDFYNRSKEKFPPAGKQWRELQRTLVQKGRIEEAREIEEKVK